MIRQLLFSAGVAVLSAQAPGTLTTTGNMIAAEPYPQAILLSNGKVLVAGYSAELYDPVLGSFGPTGAVDSRIFSSYTLLADRRVLIAGGSDLAYNTLASAELYDPSTGTITPTGNMTTPRDAPNAVLFNDGKVFIVGGKLPAVP